MKNRFVVRHCSGWLQIPPERRYAVWDTKLSAFVDGTYSLQDNVLNWANRFNSGEWNHLDQYLVDENGQRILIEREDRR